MNQELKARIEKHVAMIPECGCWIWTGILRDGYGAIYKGTKKYGAHRVAYEAYIGAIPAGASVLHRCDVRACCNPAHLWVGNSKDNVRDMNRKGRAVYRTGENHPAAKLNAAKAAEIHRRRAAGETLKQIAAAVGVSWRTVVRVIQGHAWRSVA